MIQAMNQGDFIVDEVKFFIGKLQSINAKEMIKLEESGFCRPLWKSKSLPVVFYWEWLCPPQGTNVLEDIVIVTSVGWGWECLVSSGWIPGMLLKYPRMHRTALHQKKSSDPKCQLCQGWETSI